MKFEGKKFLANLKERAIVLADRLSFFPHLLAKTELNKNIIPIVEYITRKVLEKDKRNPINKEIFEFDLEESQRVIKTTVIDNYDPKKRFLTIYAEPKKRSRRTKNHDYTGFRLGIDNGKPITFSVIKNNKEEVIYIENGKLTDIGKRMPLATILGFRSCLIQTAVAINK